MLPPRCARCHEKIPESAIPGYATRLADFTLRDALDAIGDDEFLLTDPHGRVILWLRCTLCDQLRPTTRVFRKKPFDPYASARGHGDHEPGPRDRGARSRRPPPRDQQRTKARAGGHLGGEASAGRGPTERTELPRWAKVLGISSVPPQRAAAITLVKGRWRAAVAAHHADLGRSGPAHHEAFIEKRQAYEAAQRDLGFGKHRKG